MTAQASPFRLIGAAMPESNLCLSETDRKHVLLVGLQSARLTWCEDFCHRQDIDTDLIESPHELPFRLHHARPMAVVVDLPVEGRSMAAVLRCIAAYNPSLPVLLLTEPNDIVLGTLDAARALWGLGDLSLLPQAASAHAMMGTLFRAGRMRAHHRV